MTHTPVLLKETMGSDYDICQSVSEVFHRALHLGGRTNSAEHIDSYRIAGKTPHARLVVLLGENRCGHQDRRLLAV